MTDDATDLQPGQRFGVYEIVRPLGRGAFGTVYEALRHPLKKRTALKVLHRVYIGRSDVVDRFVREAEVVAQLDHPHVVDVFDVGVEDQVPFLAMEFLEGESLAERIEREKVIAVAPAVDIMLAVMSAVAAVHEKGIVHRDIKPENIFLSRESTGSVQPKLLDFGVAKVHDASKALTHTNAIMGTPYYMSPEQAHESKNITAVSDEWSLGVVLYECVTGAKPFNGSSLLALLNAITNRPLTPPGAVNPELPDAFCAIITRTLQRDPAMRFPSVRAFGAALMPFATPRAQEQWKDFFEVDAAALVAEPEAPWSRPSFAVAETLAPTLAPTLEPTTLPSNATRKMPRLRALLPAFGAGLAVVAVTGWLALRPGEHVATARPVAPVTTTVRSLDPTPIVAPVTHVTEGVHDAGVVAPEPVAPSVDPSTVAGVDDRGAHGHGHAFRERLARSPHDAGARAPRSAPRDPANCPNGICPVD